MLTIFKSKMAKRLLVAVFSCLCALTLFSMVYIVPVSRPFKHGHRGIIITYARLNLPGNIFYNCMEILHFYQYTVQNIMLRIKDSSLL